jgi:hypothetical protein
MKYLDKSFTIYPSVRKQKETSSTSESRKPEIGHRFLMTNGVCLTCGLDKIGHNTKYGKRT